MKAPSPSRSLNLCSCQPQPTCAPRLKPPNCAQGGGGGGSGGPFTAMSAALAEPAAIAAMAAVVSKSFFIVQPPIRLLRSSPMPVVSPEHGTCTHGARKTPPAYSKSDHTLTPSGILSHVSHNRRSGKSVAEAPHWEPKKCRIINMPPGPGVETLYAYLAGIIDIDGYISITRTAGYRGHPSVYYYAPAVGIAHPSAMVADLFQEAFPARRHAFHP